MAIVSVNEITGREGGEDEEFKQTSTRLYLVLTDSATHTESDILSAAGLPVLFDVHPTLTGAMVIDRKARQSTNEDEPFLWTASITYSSVSKSKTDPATRSQNPTDRPAVLKISFEQREIGLYVDLEGDPIINSAGDPFDPPPTMEETIGIISITRNKASVDFAQYMDFNGATNEFTFMGFPPDTLKISLEAERTFEQQQYFFIVNATIRVRPFYDLGVGADFVTTMGGWQLKLLDAGYRYIDAGNNYHNIVDDEGNSLHKPYPLDGAGGGLVFGDPPKFVPSDRAVDPKDWYVVTKRRNFALLGLI